MFLPRYQGFPRGLRALAISADIDDDAVLSREFSLVIIVFFNKFHAEDFVFFAVNLRFRKQFSQLREIRVSRDIPADRFPSEQSVADAITDSKCLLLRVCQGLDDFGNFLW